MNYQAKTPEDVLLDEQSFITKGETTIRKGTMGAALLNADIIEAPDASPEERAQALEALRKLAPALKAFGLTKHLTWKNPEIRALFEQ